jgi:hypothetical protein
LFSALVGIQCHDALQPTDGSASSSIAAERIYSSGAVTDRAGVSVALAKRDPEAFLRYCRANYDRNVRDYTCTFVKQEKIGGSLRLPETIAVHFRQQPFSVDMKWLENPVQAKRALFVEDAWMDDDGSPLAWFQPAGAILKLFVPQIQQPIHGRRAKSASRRSMDQFGFGQTMYLIMKYIEHGRENGVLDLRFVGVGSMHDRPTLVFERYLPYNGTEEPYPDALLRFHIDEEWLVPTACYSYADRDGESLLGSYVMTDVQFNVGLTDDHFDPEKLGF